MIENYYENEKLEYINKYIKCLLDGDYCKSGTIGNKGFFEYNKEIDIYYYNKDNITVSEYNLNEVLSFERVTTNKLENVLIDRQKCFDECDLDNVIEELRKEIEESEFKVFVFKLDYLLNLNKILLTYVIK